MRLNLGRIRGRKLPDTLAGLTAYIPPLSFSCPVSKTAGFWAV